jgi:nitroimidazol reductase NimA-like FMN-containing flavoprotein (pyridoxamine 5'-phosphate oxidase superfamily)
MADSTVQRMDGLEIADFLAAQSTGVLSLADGGEGYAIPVSFAFDEAGHDVYFRLGYTGESQKRRYVEAVDRAAFVTYDHTDEGWKSVVARGPIETLTDSSLDTAVEQRVGDIDVPYFTVHAREAGDMAFHLVRLDADELDGIVEG